MLGTTLSDSVIADAHAPLPTDLSSNLEAGGGRYLDVIAEMHRKPGGRERHDSTKRQPRRDKGGARNVQRLEENRTQKGKPEIEQSLLRRREAAIEHDVGKSSVGRWLCRRTPESMPVSESSKSAREH